MTKHTNNSLLQFPCEFPIKVIGRSSIEFEGLVVGIIRKHAPDLSEAAVSIRNSKKKNYTSMTITMNANSQEQLDSIYTDLSNHKDVIMAL